MSHCNPCNLCRNTNNNICNDLSLTIDTTIAFGLRFYAFNITNNCPRVAGNVVLSVDFTGLFSSASAGWIVNDNRAILTIPLLEPGSTIIPVPNLRFINSSPSSVISVLTSNIRTCQPIILTTAAADLT